MVLLVPSCISQVRLLSDVPASALRCAGKSQWNYARHIPCLEIQSKMKSGAAFYFPQEKCLLQMVLSFSLYPV